MAEEDKQNSTGKPHPHYQDKCPAPLDLTGSPKHGSPRHGPPNYQSRCPPPLDLSGMGKPVHPNYQNRCPPPLDLSAQLSAFDKSSLRKTDTVVTLPDGKQVVEGKDEEGHTITKSVSFGSGLGFCADTREDLQVGQVLPGLIVGSQDVAHDLSVLERHKVSHILNVASHVDNQYPDKFTYLTLDLRDLPDFPILKAFQPALDFIDAALEAGGCVLVHCNAGISRSATIVLAYLMKKKGMSLNDAFSYLRSKRPSSFPNPGFMIQLKTFEQSLGIASS